MVDVRLKGGLGNQLFQFATSHALSKKLNCELKVDICFYKVQLFRSLDINQVDIQLKILPRSECISLGAPLNFRNKAIRKFGLTSKTFPSNLEEIQPFIYDSRIELLEGPVYLDGYWQNLNYFEDYNNELRSLLTPGGEFSCAYYDYLDQIINSESVSLHIRRGGYVNDPHTKSINYVFDSDYYLKAVKFIKERVNNPNFFIFSDDIYWCEKNFDYLDHKVFIQNTANAIEDFQLMWSCRYNIISNSTFCWWAATLNENNEKISISLSYWQVGLGLQDINLVRDLSSEKTILCS